MNLEFRHLRYFIAVAEELHFGRAAARLCIAQPPLSQQIQQLERELGFTLFNRSNRKVELTVAGRQFLDDVRESMAALDRAIQEGRRAAKGDVGRLRVGFVGTATFSALPTALRDYRMACPEVQLSLRELVSARQAQALRERRIHVGFARPAVFAPDLVCETLITEKLIAALPVGHRLASAQVIDLTELAHDDFVLFPRLPRPSYGDFLQQVCQNAGFRPNVTQETAEVQTAISLVAGGIGVTLLPASAGNLQRQGVSFVTLSEPAPTSDLCLVYRKEDDTPTLESFLKSVRVSLSSTL